VAKGYNNIMREEGQNNIEWMEKGMDAKDKGNKLEVHLKRIMTMTLHLILLSRMWGCLPFSFPP
jgi:hypothetical protein